MPIEMLRVALRAGAVRLFVDGPVVQVDRRRRFRRRRPKTTARCGSTTRGATPTAPYPRSTCSTAESIRSASAKLVLIGMTGLASPTIRTHRSAMRMPGSEDPRAGAGEPVRPDVARAAALGATSRARACLCAVRIAADLGHATLEAAQRGALASACTVALLVGAAFARFSRGAVFDAATPALGLLILFSPCCVLTLREATRRARRSRVLVQAQREQAAYIAGELQAAQRIQTGILPSRSRCATTTGSTSPRR